jgi:hypothetical protein
MPEFTIHGPEYLSEADRATVRVNDIVVDVIANEDGSVYVEFYAYGTDQVVEVSDLFVDRRYHHNPSVRLMLKTRTNEDA